MLGGQHKSTNRRIYRLRLKCLVVEEKPGYILVSRNQIPFEEGRMQDKQ
jgi:hypothetical protein